MRRPRFTGGYEFGYGFGPQGAPLRRGRRRVVAQGQRGLMFRDGVLIKEVDPGAHRTWQRGFSLRVIDMRPSILMAPTQEIPTADGVTVKITVSGSIAVIDATRYSLATEDARESLYLRIQVALRDVITSTSVEDLLSARAELGARLTATVGDVSDIGYAISELQIKDIILPADLKRAQSEVLIARAEGLAALERARGETAALRNLLNAARLAADNPALLQLRLLHQLESSSGHTVVIKPAG